MRARPEAPVRVVLYGAQGYAVMWRHILARRPASAPLAEVVAFIDDAASARTPPIDGIPVVSFSRFELEYRDTPCLITVGDPVDRRRLAQRVLSVGGRFAKTDYSAQLLDDTISVGEGSLLARDIFVCPWTTIGAHTQVMPMSAVGHDCRIGNYVTIAGSCVISGYVEIGDGAFLGAGSIVVHGKRGRPLTIGPDAFVAAGAVVTRSVPAGSRVYGNPARSARELVARRRRAGPAR